MMEISIPRTAVAFDFDKTLTRFDSLRLFLLQAASLRRLVFAGIGSGPQMVAGLWSGSSRDKAKAKLVRRLLSGRTEAEVTQWAEKTAEIIIESGLRDDTVRCLRWHQDNGSRIIVVSASFEAYVRPVVSTLGVTEVIATRWQVDPVTLRLTGNLEGSNIRGPQKVLALRARLGRTHTLNYAYGDSRGDREMLSAAYAPVWVRSGQVRLPNAG